MTALFLAAAVPDRVAGAAVEALEVIEAQVRGNYWLHRIRSSYTRAQFNLNPQRGTPREDKLLASYVRTGSFSKLQQ